MSEQDDALGPVEGAVFRTMFPPVFPDTSREPVPPERIAELDAEWERVLSDAEKTRKARAWR